MFELVSDAITKIFGKQVDGDKTVYSPVDKDALKRYNASRSGGPKQTLCYAPFKSLYFGHRGKVFACCYNRQYTLGVVPEKSIREIWFGEEAERLRRYIQNNDLSLGCTGCENHFTAANFDAIKAKMYDHYSGNKKKFPSVMEFELSNTCNLECIMCNGEFSSSIRKNREKKPALPEVYGDDFVEQLEEFIPWLEEVKFYGGEPFLVDVYYKIWERIAVQNPSCKISVQTNATVLNGRLKDLLSKNKFNLNISLDSLEKNSYEAIRVNANFETVMQNIEYFRQYAIEKNTFFGISCCAMRDNWRELPAFVNFCNQIQVPVYFHTVWSPVDRALWNLSSEVLSEICTYLEQFSFPEESAVQIKNRLHYLDTLKLIKSWYKAAQAIELDMEKYRVGQHHSAPKQVLYNNMKAEILADSSMPLEERERKLDACFSKIIMFIGVLPDNDSIGKIVDYVNALPVNKLVADLERDRQEFIVKDALSSIFNSSK